MSDKIVNVQPQHSQKLIITGSHFNGEKAQALAVEYGIHPRTTNRIYNQYSYASSSAKHAAERFIPIEQQVVNNVF